MSDSKKMTSDNKPAEASENGLDKTTSIDIGGVQMRKPPKSFTLLSAASLGYAISNTPVGVLLVVGSAMFGAGPLFFYGTFLIIVVSFSVAISLGELASAYPHPGGQYFWVAQLAPPPYKRFASYMTAIISWASVVCIGASSCSGCTAMLFALVAIKNPNFEYHQWQGFLVFEAFNIAAFSFNLFERFIPRLAKGFLLLSLITAVAYFIALLAADSPKQTAHGFFAEYYNSSGWPNGVAFFIGLSGVNWGFSCLDAVTHLAEEIPDPRRNIPKALLITVCIAAITGISTVIAIFLAAYDLPNTVYIVSLVYQVYHENPIPTLVLGVILLLSTWASLIGIHTWQARIAWSLSRDKGFPFYSYLSRLAPPPFDTPFWAHVWSTTWISLCGFLYLGSLTAFNSFISAGIVLQYMTYSTPVIFLLIKGRQNFAHGPFFLPRLGLVANVILLCWTTIATVFYSFPLYLPVLAKDMNYLAAVLCVVFLYALGYWFAYGHKHYTMTSLAVIDE